jgi:uncharacterized membrane protein YfcA
MTFATLFAPEVLSLGLAIGLVLGATGAGGGILSVPLLTIVLKLDVNQAGPIGLLAVAFASSIAAILGLREGIVRYKAAALMAVVGLMMSPLGFSLAQKLPNEPLVALFAVVLTWVAIRMWRNSAPATALDENLKSAASTFSCEQNTSTGKFIWTLPCTRALSFTGGLAGLLSGLIGVGGGFIIVPSLKANTTLNMRSIIATSLAVIALVSAGGVVMATTLGTLNWSIGLPFSLGTVLGMLGGRYFAKHVPQKILSRSFSCLALLAAALMLLKLF